MDTKLTYSNKTKEEREVLNSLHIANLCLETTCLYQCLNLNFD